MKPWKEAPALLSKRIDCAECDARGDCTILTDVEGAQAFSLSSGWFSFVCASQDPGMTQFLFYCSQACVEKVMRELAGERRPSK